MKHIDWVERDGADGRSGSGPGGRGTWQGLWYRGRGSSRPYFLYTPAGLDPGISVPLVVLLHGCNQAAVDLAAATRMNEAADRHGFVVAYPQQTSEHNRQACWNWFLPHHQARGAGEPAAIAAITREVLRSGSRHPVDRDRVFLAGLSAGGAMAAVVGWTYPDLFAAIGVHSGLPYATARNQDEAFEAMAYGGAHRDGRGLAAFRAMGPRARLLPGIVVHGTSDDIVSPINGDQLAHQWLAANGLAAPARFQAVLSQPSAVVRDHVEDGHPYTRYRWLDRQGRLVVEYLKVGGLGHAWSGGSRTASWADCRGPDATSVMWEFFAQVGRR